MPTASGFQIAFLVLAFEFFSMLGSTALAPVIGWPADRMELLGQLTTFSVATLILFGHSGLRRCCLEALREPLPKGSSTELMAATAIKLAIPFAFVGAVVAGAFAAGAPESIVARIPTIDPLVAWEYTLSPLGAVRLVLLSWLVGPVIEELVFRAFLYRAFERRFGWVASTALTSLLFGLAHPTRILQAALGSVVLVCLLRRTGTLRACILVHVIYNVLISWPLFGHFLFTAPEGAASRLSTWGVFLASLVFACAALPAYLWMSRGSAGREAKNCVSRR